jgi:hypothetical protein
MSPRTRKCQAPERPNVGGQSQRPRLTAKRQEQLLEDFSRDPLSDDETARLLAASASEGDEPDFDAIVTGSAHSPRIRC